MFGLFKIQKFITFREVSTTLVINTCKYGSYTSLYNLFHLHVNVLEHITHI